MWMWLWLWLGECLFLLLQESAKAPLRDEMLSLGGVFCRERTVGNRWKTANVFCKSSTNSEQ
jgi:hypothetical protein